MAPPNFPALDVIVGVLLGDNGVAQFNQVFFLHREQLLADLLSLCFGVAGNLLKFSILAVCGLAILHKLLGFNWF
jgi:hypothetical protein